MSRRSSATTRCKCGAPSCANAAPSWCGFVVCPGVQAPLAPGCTHVVPRVRSDPKVKDHLFRVHALLATTVLAAAVGAYAHMRFHFGGFMTSIALVGVLYYFWATPKQNVDLRMKLLMVFGFLKGVSVAPLIERAIYIDPAVLVTALLGTVSIFALFSLSALLAPRRSWFSIGATLGSAMLAMAVAGLVNIWMRSALVDDTLLYGGLVVFCLYVCVDTRACCRACRSVRAT
jgi:FtsH-binding integral membrane protein